MSRKPNTQPPERQVPTVTEGEVRTTKRRRVILLPGSHNRDAVILRAIEVIGDEQEAWRWLGTPVRALNYATPISRLNDREGQEAVLNVLIQLEHGVL